MIQENRLPLYKFGVGIALVMLLTIAYGGIHAWRPADPFWRELLLNLIPTGAALVSAFNATRIWRQFAPTDTPLPVWRGFALGLWAWAVAEVFWTGYAMVYHEEMPSLTPADLFWAIGYLCFAAALYYQYRLVFHLRPGQHQRVLVGAVAAVLLVSAIATVLLRKTGGVAESWLATFVATYYPFADVAIGAAALVLVGAFRRGLWARPWRGLLVFAVSDALYAWGTATGFYVLYGVGNFFSLIVDTLYLLAYLFVAVACYAHLQLLRYGPRWRYGKAAITETVTE